MIKFSCLQFYLFCFLSVSLFYVFLCVCLFNIWFGKLYRFNKTILNNCNYMITGIYINIAIGWYGWLTEYVRFTHILHTWFISLKKCKYIYVCKLIWFVVVGWIKDLVSSLMCIARRRDRFVYLVCEVVDCFCCLWASSALNEYIFTKRGLRCMDWRDMCFRFGCLMLFRIFHFVPSQACCLKW